MPEPEADTGPEPGTNEWAYATGNYIDPEPDWDGGEPYADHAHGVMYYDTAAGFAAGRERYPGWRHVGPEPEAEALEAEAHPKAQADLEAEAEPEAEIEPPF